MPEIRIIAGKSGSLGQTAGLFAPASAAADHEDPGGIPKRPTGADCSCWLTPSVVRLSSPGANLNATRSGAARRAEGGKPDVIHIPRGAQRRKGATRDERGFSHIGTSEGYPSGQRGQTVNLLAYAFGGSNPPPSTNFVNGRCSDMEVDANHRTENAGSTDSPGASRNATRKRRGPGGAEGRMPGVIHLPPSQQQATRPQTTSVIGKGGSSSMVELQPSKLTVRVRFPSPAPVSYTLT